MRRSCRLHAAPHSLTPPSFHRKSEIKYVPLLVAHQGYGAGLLRGRARVRAPLTTAIFHLPTYFSCTSPDPSLPCCTCFAYQLDRNKDGSPEQKKKKALELLKFLAELLVPVTYIMNSIHVSDQFEFYNASYSNRSCVYGILCCSSVVCCNNERILEFGFTMIRILLKRCSSYQYITDSSFLRLAVRDS